MAAFSNRNNIYIDDNDDPNNPMINYIITIWGSLKIDSSNRFNRLNWHNL